MLLSDLFDVLFRVIEHTPSLLLQDIRLSPSERKLLFHRLLELLLQDLESIRSRGGKPLQHTEDGERRGLLAFALLLLLATFLFRLSLLLLLLRTLRREFLVSLLLLAAPLFRLLSTLLVFPPAPLLVLPALLVSTALQLALVLAALLLFYLAFLCARLLLPPPFLCALLFSPPSFLFQTPCFVATPFSAVKPSIAIVTPLAVPLTNRSPWRQFIAATPFPVRGYRFVTPWVAEFLMPLVGSSLQGRLTMGAFTSTAPAIARRA
mmetsp:Transcript_64781/g.180278  ORF Transcript_64781/g.180278 Transcript_64781/m.180278 type:complete len:264 (-) Transcript_64781:734-1525(-)